MEDAPNRQISVVSSQTGFKFDEAPLLLFEEISKYLGCGEEKHIKTGGLKYRVRELNPNHRATGFAGAIGYSKPAEFAFFVIWEGVPENTNPNLFEPKPILKITAGPQFTRSWAYGSGNLIVEIIEAETPSGMGGISLLSPAIKLVSLVLLRAHQLVTDPNCVKPRRYWEAEMFPDRDYTDG